MKRWLALALIVAACSGGGTPVTAPDTTADTVTAPDQRTGSDTVDAGADVARDVGWTFDLSTDSPAGPDVPFVECEPGSGCFLDPCDENAECQSGWCVEHLGDGVCTQNCQEECPPGWSCQPVGTGPDVAFVCISGVANLCRPCAVGGDCKSPGGAEDVCVDYGDEGAFCGGACDGDEDCPWGFSCADTVTVAGVETRQCVADAGVCPCTAKSVALALATPCAVANEWGGCSGTRTCTADGLSPCSAAQPTEELCDGVDNDCDGDVDEPIEVDGNYVNLCDDGNACTTDACQGEAGCQHQSLDAGECIDGNPCTVADHCVAGICTGDPVECDDENPCTDNVCTESGGCEYPPVGGDCDDGDVCTLGDHCTDGICAGEPVNCECQVDADCAGLDQDLCLGPLVCDTAEVPYKCRTQPGAEVDCPQPEGNDAVCLSAVCNPENGECGFEPVHEGYACDDGNACTVGETCQAGACGNGVPALCGDSNPCTEDTCDSVGGCLFVAADGACDDGNACTTDDLCVDGKCTFSQMLNCDDENPCTNDTCHPLTGCSYSLNTAPCDDGDACTVGDACLLGECKGGITLQCDDGNPCTDDACQAGVGCSFKPNSKPCDDLNACTVGDHCSGGTCQAASMAGCDDGNPCTTDGCDPAAGCVNVNNELPCNDNDICTIGDACSGGFCAGGQTLDCDDGNPCTDDACTGESGCVHTANGATCSDDNACTVGDHCSAGDCVTTGLLVCDDANVCTNDNCDPEAGCIYSANAQPCSDGSVCTLDDLCVAGECVAGPAVVCPDDGNTCTTEACDDAAGCQTAAVPDCCGNGLTEAGEECDDGNQVGEDGCSAGCVLEVQKLVPGDTNRIVENNGLKVRCLEWSGSRCEHPQVMVPSATCSAYAWKDLWHTNVYGNDSELRNCPNWCALATAGNTGWSQCLNSAFGVPGDYRACAMSTTTQCAANVFTWMTDYPNQNGKLHLYLGNCYPSYNRLRVQCDGW